jgi:multidrug efflux pump subunit AcrA (membrane-fusion protein)
MENQRDHPRAAGIVSANDATWREIEQLVDSISARAAAETSPQVFYSELLERTVQALAAEGGCVWTWDTRGNLQLSCRIGFDREGLLGDTFGSPLHEQLLGDVARRRRPRSVPPGSRVADVAQGGNPTDFLLLLSPIVEDGNVVAIVELLQRPGASPASQEGYLKLLTAVCDIAAEFHRNRQLAELRRRQAVAADVDQFAYAVHATLELDTTAYTIANDGRRLIDCDRLSVLTVNGRRCQTRAISGVDIVDRRANVVRQMERLTETVLATKEPFWSLGTTQDLPPVVETRLQQFLDESHARSVAVIPLEDPKSEEQRAQPTLVGALVVEWFQAREDEASERQRVDAVVRHAYSALRNAYWQHHLPFRSVLRLLSGLRWFTRARQLPYTVSVFTVLVAIVLALVFVPAEFRVEARGEAKPTIRRDVFAPDDGIVDQILVEHAQVVSAGQLLVQMRKPELDFEFARLTGEMDTAAKQLDSVQAQRLQGNRSRATTSDDTQQLAAKEEELKKLLESLAEQQTILQRQRRQLQISSPISGRVLTWRVTERLEARPVQRGQALMAVVDPEGPWQLELQVPDHHIGYVLAAQEQASSALGVSFVLATDPGTTYRGRIARVAMATATNEQLHSTVRVTVDIDAQHIAQIRPNATVVARIECGSKRLGYVWLHDLIEVVRMRLML